MNVMCSSGGREYEEKEKSQTRVTDAGRAIVREFESDGARARKKRTSHSHLFPSLTLYPQSKNLKLEQAMQLVVQTKLELTKSHEEMDAKTFTSVTKIQGTWKKRPTGNGEWGANEYTSCQLAAKRFCAAIHTFFLYFFLSYLLSFSLSLSLSLCCRVFLSCLVTRFRQNHPFTSFSSQDDHPCVSMQLDRTRPISTSFIYL